MADTVSIVIPDGLRAAMEAAWPGSAIEVHLQAVVDRAVARWQTEAPAVIKRSRLGKYDRLNKGKRAQVDAILATAPEPVEEDPEELKTPK